MPTQNHLVDDAGEEGRWAPVEDLKLRYAENPPSLLLVGQSFSAPGRMHAGCQSSLAFLSTQALPCPLLIARPDVPVLRGAAPRVLLAAQNTPWSKAALSWILEHCEMGVRQEQGRLISVGGAEQSEQTKRTPAEPRQETGSKASAGDGQKGGSKDPAQDKAATSPEENSKDADGGGQRKQGMEESWNGSWVARRPRAGERPPSLQAPAAAPAAAQAREKAHSQVVILHSVADQGDRRAGKQVLLALQEHALAVMTGHSAICQAKLQTALVCMHSLPNRSSRLAAEGVNDFMTQFPHYNHVLVVSANPAKLGGRARSLGKFIDHCLGVRHRSMAEISPSDVLIYYQHSVLSDPASPFRMFAATRSFSTPDGRNKVASLSRRMSPKSLGLPLPLAQSAHSKCSSCSHATREQADFNRRRHSCHHLPDEPAQAVFSENLLSPDNHPAAPQRTPSAPPPANVPASALATLKSLYRGQSGKRRARGPQVAPQPQDAATALTGEEPQHKSARFRGWRRGTSQSGEERDPSSAYRLLPSLPEDRDGSHAHSRCSSESEEPEHEPLQIDVAKLRRSRSFRSRIVHLSRSRSSSESADGEKEHRRKSASVLARRPPPQPTPPHAAAGVLAAAGSSERRALREDTGAGKRAEDVAQSSQLQQRQEKKATQATLKGMQAVSKATQATVKASEATQATLGQAPSAQLQEVCEDGTRRGLMVTVDEADESLSISGSALRVLAVPVVCSPLLTPTDKPISTSAVSTPTEKCSTAGKSTSLLQLPFSTFATPRSSKPTATHPRRLARAHDLTLSFSQHSTQSSSPQPVSICGRALGPAGSGRQLLAHPNAPLHHAGLPALAASWAAAQSGRRERTAAGSALQAIAPPRAQQPTATCVSWAPQPSAAATRQPAPVTQNRSRSSAFVDADRVRAERHVSIAGRLKANMYPTRRAGSWQKVLWAIRWTAEACEALKHETINKDVCLSLAIEFSKQSDKFAGDDDIIEMWNAGTKGLLKYGSLLYWAKENGYEHKRQSYKAVDYLEKLIKKTKEADPVAVAEPVAEPVAVAEHEPEPVATDNGNYDREKSKAFLDGNDDDYAEFIHAKYKNRFICFNNAVYEFPPNAHLWDAGDDDIFHNFLRSIVFNEMMIFTDALISVAIKEKQQETDEGKMKQRDENIKMYQKKQKQMIIKLRNHSPRGGVVKCLKAKYAVKRNPFDITSNLVGFNNGAYDLVKGEFRNGKPDDYVCMSVGYNYKPPNDDAITNLRDFLKKVMPYDDVLIYLLQVLATGLYGQQLQYFFILTGSGGNGKDTLMTKLYRGMLGEYYINAPINIITKEAKESDLNQGLANLHNKRACVYVEPSAKKNLIGSSIKTLTGTDTIVARGLYEKNTEKRNVGTLFMLANDIPLIDHLDGGVARRLRVIPFPTLFKSKEEMAKLTDLTNIYEANPYYETVDFINDYKLSLFHILTKSFNDFVEQGYKLIETPEIVLKASSYYLRNCDDFMMWFNELYEKAGDKEFIQIQDVCAEFKLGDLYDNMSKRDRRIHNNKFVADKIKNHPDLRGYCKEICKPLIDGRQRKFRNVIMGYKRNHITK
eukprot:g16269.t1